MTLISLLIVLMAERIATQSRFWQIGTYFEKYFHTIRERNWLDESTNMWSLLLYIALPACLVLLVESQVNGSVLSLLISSALLMVCIGCPALRTTYKCYLQAANRGDLEACSLYAEQLGHDDDGATSFGQNLVWLNYQHYAAVVIWFAVFGAAGAVFYVVAREFRELLKTQGHPLVEQADNMMGILDWIPVRITALGFLLVGHFSKAFPIWLGYLPDPSITAKNLLSEVSRAAEDVEPDENDCTEEPCTLVKLAKRNVMFILVVVSVLTLSGWIN